MLPLLGIGFCLYLMSETGWTTWIQFAVFLVVGVLVYLGYGRRNSRLVTVTPAADATDAVPQAV